MMKYQRKNRVIFYGVVFLVGTLLGLLCGKIILKENETEATMIHKLSVDEITVEEKDDWMLVLVNQTHKLQDRYKPQLAKVEGDYYFDARAVGYLQQMLQDGRNQGLDLLICSAYRTMEKQQNLYESKVRRLMGQGIRYDEACAQAKTEVAYPGTSEHHLGLAVDIVAGYYQLLDENQAKTAEAKWLRENCWKYGFILRYPLDKTEETGIIFEPWHYRYVGKEAAKEIMERGICLEEYLQNIQIIAK